MFFRQRTTRIATDSPRPIKALVVGEATGFTLIETCIAMIVMMVVGLGATSLFLFSVRNNSGGENRSQALAIAQQQLEELRGVGFNDPKLALGERTSTVVLQNVTAGNSSTNYGGGTSASGGSGSSSAFASGDSSANFTTSGNSGPGGSSGPGGNSGPGGGSGGGSGGSGGGGGSGSGGGGSDDDTFKIELEVEGRPAGAAVPAQKQITIKVSPENGLGANSWVNRNPVVIVVHRSNPATGPYRQ